MFFPFWIAHCNVITVVSFGKAFNTNKKAEKKERKQAN